MTDFKEDYIKSKVWADLDTAIDNNLVPSEIAKLMSSLETVKEYTGIDMRQDFLLGVLKGRFPNLDKEV